MYAARFLMAFCLLTVLPTGAFAGCNWSAQIVQEYIADAQSAGERPVVIKLRRTPGEPKYIIALTTHPLDATKPQHWFIFERCSPTAFEVLAQGELHHRLLPLGEGKVQSFYGLPGAGRPRCTEWTSDPLTAMDVAQAVSKELGDTYRLSLEPKYQLVMSKRADGWSLIESEQRGSEWRSCLVDAGSALSFESLN